MTNAKLAPTVDQVEASFREALENVIDFADRFGKHCQSVDDLVQLAKQGLDNPALLRVYLETMAQPSNPRR